MSPSTDPTKWCSLWTSIFLFSLKI
jgi:hypothetical protein